MHYRVLSTIAWYIGRLKILAGIAALAAATAILALSSGRRNDNQNSQMSLKLISLILAAFSLFFFTEGEWTHRSRA